MIYGEITISVVAITTPPRSIFLGHDARRARTKAGVINIERKSGLTLSQQAMPKRTPAPVAQQILPRFRARTREHSAAMTNHVVGASAEGETPTIASKGESATRKLETIATRQP